MLPPPPWLMLVTEASPNKHVIVNAAIAGGVNLIYQRNESSFRERFPKLVLKMGYGRGGSIYEASRTDFLKCEKNGLHLSENGDINARDLRETFRLPYVGRSIHSVERALWAVEDGADYLIAGTIYSSNSHPGAPGQEIGFLRQVCEAVAPLPVIAIGGITTERVGACIAAGAAGVAVLSPIMRSADPRAVARAYRIELDKAWSLRSTENR